MNLKQLFASALLVAASAAVSAQSLYVKKNDGTVHEYDLNKVSQVSFDETAEKQEIRTVTYYVNDGTEDSQVSQTHVAKPSVIGSDVSFARDGFILLSWNTKPDGTGTTFSNGEICISQHSLDLYAQWRQPKGTEEGHDWVDLGLPSGTRWATTNVGAANLLEYGDYFAWGETEGGKRPYDWSTYKYGSANDALTKYCYDSKYGKDGYEDDKMVLDASDDAATANWGGKWRMPTNEEFAELLNEKYCTWTWTRMGGSVPGYMVRSKIIPEAFIFLPAAGTKYNLGLNAKDMAGYYWSSSLYRAQDIEGSPSTAWNLLFFSDSNPNPGGSVEYGTRTFGFSVRPVCHP